MTSKIQAPYRYSFSSDQNGQSGPRLRVVSIVVFAYLLPPLASVLSTRDVDRRHPRPKFSGSESRSYVLYGSEKPQFWFFEPQSNFSSRIRNRLGFRSDRCGHSEPDEQMVLGRYDRSGRSAKIRQTVDDIFVHIARRRSQNFRRCRFLYGYSEIAVLAWVSYVFSITYAKILKIIKIEFSEHSLFRCESSADDYDYRACVFDADVVAAYQISEQRFLECMGPEQQ